MKAREAGSSEMRRSRVVVSPFGLGEITLKDFEAMLCGALLLKPNLEHMETFPHLLEPGVTVETHRWDLSDLDEIVDALLADPERSVEMARAAQDRYRGFLASEDGFHGFCRHFASLVDTARR